MALIADSGAIYGLYDASDLHHSNLCAAVRAEPGAVIIPAVILSEVDYLLRIRLGIEAELEFLDDIRRGSFTVENVNSHDLVRVRNLLHQYRSLDLGLADAAVMATADRLRVRRILTVDERDFRAVESASGRPFVLIPADLA